MYFTHKFVLCANYYVKLLNTNLNNKKNQLDVSLRLWDKFGGVNYSCKCLTFVLLYQGKAPHS